MPQMDLLQVPPQGEFDSQLLHVLCYVALAVCASLNLIPHVVRKSLLLCKFNSLQLLFSANIPYFYFLGSQITKKIVLDDPQPG